MNSKDNPQDFYVQQSDKTGHTLELTTVRIRWFGILRLVCFLLIVLAIFGLLPMNVYAGTGSLIILIPLFLLLIKQFNKLTHRRAHLKALLQILDREKKALLHQYHFFDAGSEFIDPQHAFSYDMDIFGEGSLFQYLNRTVTISGRNILAGLMTSPNQYAESILSRQQAIDELRLQVPHLLHFRATGSNHADSQEDIEEIRQWIHSESKIPFGPVARKLILIMPVLFTLLLVTGFFYYPASVLAVVLFLLNLFIVSRYFSRTSREHNRISRRLASLEKYRKLLSETTRLGPRSPELSDIYEKLSGGDHSAEVAISSLARIVKEFDMRLNLVAAIFLEGIFLWDLRKLIQTITWKQTYGTFFDDWMEALGRFDALSSLAFFAFNHPGFARPAVGSHVLKSQALGHVLIPPGERVCNDFEIGARGDFVIITGANMAGKSTFLRTVATNLILAGAGAPVCAAEFEFTPMPLFSSMRTSDSLNKHESYFYAELKRLKELLDRLKEGESLFIILDEILKGTNSVDKQKGSYAALQQIIKLRGTGIIATHDLELAKIEQEHSKQIRNMCFEIEIDRADISFDYKLRNGITTKMNASLLMEQMGIISSQDLS